MNSEELLDSYRKRIERELKGEPEEVKSVDYENFRKENLPKEFSLYEKLCNYSEKIFKIEPDKKKVGKIESAIKNSHLRITPTGVMSFAILGPMAFALFGILFSIALIGDTLFIMFFVIFGMALVVILQKIPMFIETSWRMRAGNQLVLSVFYIVTYMRHTSNLENAVEFASNHLDAPLSIDMKKILWDVETQKYESVKEALNAYLNSWSDWNRDYIESMNLVVSSLYEGDEARRLDALDKSLSVILDGTYESMLHYAHNLKGPITMIHMLGVILPILGLVILPLVVSFMDNVRWFHIALIYNLALPIMVYYLGRQTLSTRPSGYGHQELKSKKKNPMMKAVFVAVVLILIGFLPVLLPKSADFCLTDKGLQRMVDVEGVPGLCFLDYKETAPGVVKGPYGLGAALLGVLVVTGAGMGVSLYYSSSSKKLIAVRRKSKSLEKEFASALFQLGGRLGDGMPIEMAFGKVAASMEGTASGDFFTLVDRNIRSLGMGVEDAIYNEKNGAILNFPSKVIDSSMKVLIESAKKGPMIASQALSNVSRYIKEIHRVDERLQDLMGDIVGSMKSQIKFLTPVISGIVVGITSMITGILGRLQGHIGQISTEVGGGVGGAGVMDMFGAGIPTYFFQIVVGIYVIQIGIILIILSNQIQNGSDKVMQDYRMGKELGASVLLYSVLCIVVMLIFNIIANVIMSSTL